MYSDNIIRNIRIYLNALLFYAEIYIIYEVEKTSYVWMMQIPRIIDVVIFLKNSNETGLVVFLMCLGNFKAIIYFFRSKSTLLYVYVFYICIVICIL